MFKNLILKEEFVLLGFSGFYDSSAFVGVLAVF